MPSQWIHFIGALLALTTFLFAVNACGWNKCGNDFLGSTTMTTPIKMRRITLEPYNAQQIITIHPLVHCHTRYVPLLSGGTNMKCYTTQGVLAYACAQDVEPLVKVISFKEVMVQRNSAPWPGKDVFVDITVYCNQLLEKLRPSTNASLP